VRLFLRGRVDSGDLYRHSVGSLGKCVSLVNNQLPSNCDKSRQ